MTKSIEAIAELYRRQGWEKQARELEADAQRFKAEGIPEHFESNVQEQAHALRRQWVEVLAGERVEPNRPKEERVLTSVLAAKLNSVGQKFDDSTPLSVLAVNTRETYANLGTSGRQVLGVEQRYEIDARIVRPYNKLINLLLRLDLETVGQVRTVHPRGFYKELQMRELSRGYRGPRNLNPDSLQFMQDALMRSLQARPLATGE